MSSPAPSLRTDVSVLYVDPRGPYPSLVSDWWDATRDARGYEGPNPVVAHPPCGPWGRLSHLCSAQDPTCGPAAVEAVRRWGGVLEHPAWSRLFDHCRMPPGAFRRLSWPDAYGGRTIEIDQCDFGHVARKPTWLYLVGISECWPPLERRAPTHYVSGCRERKGRGGGLVPPGIKICSAQQRRRTPLGFAQWLVSLAAAARR